MGWGTWTAYGIPKIGDPGSHFGSPLSPFPFTDTLIYTGFTAILLNLIVAVVLTVILRALNVDPGADQTSPATTTPTKVTWASRRSSTRTRPPPTPEV